MDKSKIKQFAFKMRELFDSYSHCEETTFSWFLFFVAWLLLKGNGHLPGNEINKRKFLDDSQTINQWLPEVFTARDLAAVNLFPAELANGQSPLIKLASQIPRQDWHQVELPGWLYQYYVTEKQKRLVGINKGQIAKEDLAAATQLFTPSWIVKYLVENSLGKFWLSGNAYSKLQHKWDYLIKPVNITAHESDTDPSGIKILDPACGSGHILVYAFEVLFDIYLTAGYSPTEIPRLILKQNLYGLDIDVKAIRLTRLALIVKAAAKDPSIFKEAAVLNIEPIHETDHFSASDMEAFAGAVESSDKDKVQHLVDRFTQAGNFGSLLDTSDLDLDFINRRLAELKSAGDCRLIEKFKPIVRQAEIMSARYTVVITNPPYLNRKAMNNELKQFLSTHFKVAQSDLFAAFIKKCCALTQPGGYTAMMTPFVWMFIKSYKDLRRFLLDERGIDSLVQLEYSAFEEATVPICAFTICNHAAVSVGTYVRLSEFKGADSQPEKLRQAVNNPTAGYRYHVNSDKFSQVPGSPIAYWIEEKLGRCFQKMPLLADSYPPRQGLATGANKQFLKFWWEVGKDNISFGCSSSEEAIANGKKWFPYNKGGAYRRWYGNNLYVINWQNNGEQIKQYRRSVIRNERFYFQPGITWSFVSSARFAARWVENGFLFDVGGSSVFPSVNDRRYVLALLNSNLTREFLAALNPTLNFQVGNIGKLPTQLNIDSKLRDKIDQLVEHNIAIAKADWDCFELSWDFSEHPFIIYRREGEPIEQAYYNWQKEASRRFDQLRHNEQKINQILIESYQLCGTVSPKVSQQDISLRRAQLNRDVKSFLAYAVGCVNGRYHLSQFQKMATDLYGEQDLILAEHVIDLIKQVFGEVTLTRNLDFIANALGKRKGETSKLAIKRYLNTQFYKDHYMVFKKAPIYVKNADD